MRVGLGYDIHQLVEERDLIMGGVKIEHDKGLLGHSDADVLIHAIIDAILGSLALNDIGTHFPDTDERYKGVSSLFLLKEVKKLIKGHRIINIDSNIICQKPKLAPYIEQMRKNIASALELDMNCVSIKAKTNEKMDAVGACQAIEAQAIVLVD